MNKIDELKICTTAYETFEILCLTETHLHKTILDSEIEVTGFKFFRRDRDLNIRFPHCMATYTEWRQILYGVYRNAN